MIREGKEPERELRRLWKKEEERNKLGSYTGKERRRPLTRSS